jgi:uncharacterized protein (TIGR03086 family)
MDLVAAASADFERVVAALPPGSWDRPTPSEVSVRELVEHVVAGNLFTAGLLAGASRDDARAAVASDPLGGDPLSAVTASCAAQREAFAAAAPDQTVPHPNGDLPVEAFRRFRLVDLVVHAWDLTRAAGLDERLDPAVVRGLWDLVEPHLSEMAAFGAYGDGPTPDLPDDTPLQTRLLDAFGRRP